jgi:hypothetical protein
MPADRPTTTPRSVLCGVSRILSNLSRFAGPAKAVRSSSTAQLAPGKVHLMLQLSRTPVIYLSTVGTTASGRMLYEPSQCGTTTPSSS